jgi:2-keto-4-pentenoate hydratase/2-oxohepta-3-ene-1,7-dioic acid hydratase in catechol pathway
MRIARFRHDGAESWGFVTGDRIATAPNDAPGIPAVLALPPAELASVEARAGAPVPLADVELLAPVPDPPQFIGVGLNYRDHAEESGMPVPEVPITFGFLNSAIIDPGIAIELPPFTDEVDWEVELAIVIGRGGRDIPLDEAMAAVAGYTIVNDLSARDIQMREGQWSRAKSFDTFKPMGPWITTTDELGTAGSLAVKLWVNDVIKQDGSTVELVFDVPALVSRLSASVTLQPGAVISTGTPPGVGFAMKPPEFLQAGDTVTLEIEGIGRLSNPVVSG